MKKGMIAVLLFAVLSLPAYAHAFVYGSNQACAVAPYEVTVSYTPIQPQAAEFTYCECLPYGCPDGAPIGGQPCGCNSGVVSTGFGNCIGGLFSGIGCLVEEIWCGSINLVHTSVCDVRQTSVNLADNSLCMVAGVVGCLGVGCNTCDPCSSNQVIAE